MPLGPPSGDPAHWRVTVPVMVGWNVQWYPNVPAVPRVMGALVSPGAMVPVSKAPPSAVAVCSTESAFRQATDWPALRVTDTGEYEFAPFMPVMVMITGAAPTVKVLPPGPATLDHGPQPLSEASAHVAPAGQARAIALRLVPP